MQTSHLNEIVERGYHDCDRPDSSTEPRSLFADMQAAKIKAECKNVPPFMGTPSAMEVMSMVEYVKAYRAQSPKASRRQVRKAVKARFNIHILPKL